MNDDKQRTIDPRIQAEYDRAIANGVSVIQLIPPKNVRVWKNANEKEVYHFNIHRCAKKEQAARYNPQTGILTVEYKHHLPLSNKGHYPDIITMQAEGKKALQSLFNKRRHELIYIIDGCEARKIKGEYFADTQLVTRLSHRPSERTLQQMESIFRDVVYHDSNGVNQWEQEIKKSRIESVIRCRKNKEYGERMEPPTLTIE